MNTTNDYIDVAESYYKAMVEKRFDKVESYLHPEVHLISPLSEINGRDNVVSSARGLAQVLERIEIRARFREEDQIVLVYDFIFTNSVGKLQASALMGFKEGLIASIELFYDGRPFVI